MIMREKEQELEQQQPTKTSLKLEGYRFHTLDQPIPVAV